MRWMSSINIEQWKRFQAFIPANLREGSRYFLDNDNIGASFKYQPVAVA